MLPTKFYRISYLTKKIMFILTTYNKNRQPVKLRFWLFTNLITDIYS